MNITLNVDSRNGQAQAPLAGFTVETLTFEPASAVPVGTSVGLFAPNGAPLALTNATTALGVAPLDLCTKEVEAFLKLRSLAMPAPAYLVVGSPDALIATVPVEVEINALSDPAEVHEIDLPAQLAKYVELAQAEAQKADAGATQAQYYAQDARVNAEQARYSAEQAGTIAEKVSAETARTVATETVGGLVETEAQAREAADAAEAEAREAGDAEALEAAKEAIVKAIEALPAATVVKLGLVKLGTSNAYTTNNAAVVGASTGNQLMVPMAAAKAFGTVKLCTDTKYGTSGVGWTAFSSGNQLVVMEPTVAGSTAHPGVVLPGSRGDTPEGYIAAATRIGTDKRLYADVPEGAGYPLNGDFTALSGDESSTLAVGTATVSGVLKTSNYASVDEAIAERATNEDVRGIVETAIAEISESDPVYTTEWRDGTALVAGDGAEVIDASTVAIAIGKSATNYTSGGVAIGACSLAGDGASVGGGGAIAIGRTASAPGMYGIAIGTNSAPSDDSVSIGYSTFSSGLGVSIGEEAKGDSDSVSLGGHAESSTASVTIGAHADGGNYGIAIGACSQGGEYGVAVGHCSTDNYYSVAVGAYAWNTPYGVAVGHKALDLSNGYGVAIGNVATVAEDAPYGIAVGAGAMSEAFGTVSVGGKANAYMRNTIAVGYSAEAYSDGTVALGACSSGYSAAVSIGKEANAGGSGSISIGASSWAHDDSRSAITIGVAAEAYNTTSSTQNDSGSVVIGAGSKLYGRNGVILGSQAKVDNAKNAGAGDVAGSVVIGYGSVDGMSTGGVGGTIIGQGIHTETASGTLEDATPPVVIGAGGGIYENGAHRGILLASGANPETQQRFWVRFGFNSEGAPEMAWGVHDVATGATVTSGGKQLADLIGTESSDLATNPFITA